jgi:hypothetical protein
MTQTPIATSPAARIRQLLDHPIIDTDGHVLEVAPVLVAYLHDVAGAKVAEAYANSFAFRRYTAPWTAVPDDPRAPPSRAGAHPVLGGW